MARTGRPKQPLVLEPAEREQLQRWARPPETDKRLAPRRRVAVATVLADSSIEALDYVDVHAPGRPSVGGSGHALPPVS